MTSTPKWVACTCADPVVKSLTGRTAAEYPDQYCGLCGRWLAETLRLAMERALATLAEPHVRLGVQPPRKLSEQDLELCAVCELTFEGHVGNTGCVYPCWTPSGRYRGRQG